MTPRQFREVDQVCKSLHFFGSESMLWAYLSMLLERKLTPAEIEYIQVMYLGYKVPEDRPFPIAAFTK